MMLAGSHDKLTESPDVNKKPQPDVNVKPGYICTGIYVCITTASGMLAQMPRFPDDDSKSSKKETSSKLLMA